MATQRGAGTQREAGAERGVAGRPGAARRGPGRRASHSLEQILEAAIAILDREGPKGLTVRALATELGGGLGSIYWYVEGKDSLLALACDAVVGQALAQADDHASKLHGGGTPAALPLETSDPAITDAVGDLRRLAMALFEQTQTHPWLAPQMQVQAVNAPNALLFWERLGRAHADMGLSKRQQFFGSTAVAGYVTGVAAEMAMQDQRADPTRPQAEQLDEVVDEWLATDPTQFKWIHSIADEFRGHDDRDQFAAGLDLLVAGLVNQALERRGTSDSS